MNITDYLLMLAFVVGAAYVMERMVRWLRGWTAAGAYRAGSDSPPWGWPVTVIIGTALVTLFLIGPALAARMIGV